MSNAERIAVLETQMNDLEQARQEDLDSARLEREAVHRLLKNIGSDVGDLTKRQDTQKGFVGGIIFAVSSVASAVAIAIAYFYR